MKADFKDLTGKYALHMKARNLKAKTVKDSLWHLRRFLDFLELHGVHHPDGVTRDMVRAYRIAQYEHINSLGRPNSVRYQNMILQAVKRFTAFLREAEYVMSDPAAGIPYAKEPQTLPRSILSPAEARKILAAPDVKCATGYRNRTMLEVLYVTGMRKSELENLTLADVDYHDGFLRINQGKGAKDRIVPIGRIACRYLENYIKSVRPQLVKNPHDQHLFLSIRGNKINSNMLLHLIKKYGRKAKLKKNIHCHTFRHSCATSMLKNKAGIRVIQELLGHKSLLSTQIYTHVSINDLKAVHRQCHPREMDKQ